MYNKLVRLSLGTDFSNFYPHTIQFNQLPQLMCSPNVLYSPTQYVENKRKSANYKGFADFIVLDFDEGWTEQLEELFNKWIGYKVPTKSHMKEKNGVVCERYRVVLLVDKPIQLNYQEYKRMYKHIMRDLKLTADKSCVDACRFYYSAQQDISNCIQLKGIQYFPWQDYVYQDFQFAGLNENQSIDVSNYKDIDVSIFENMQHSKRYPCPICQREGFDQKGHHLGFNKDEDYPTCFFDEQHSKILRKLYNQYKHGTIETEMEKINDMVRAKCTPDLILTGRYDPHPTNYSDKLLDLYDTMLDALEKDYYTELDIETFSEFYVSETLEEAENRLKDTHKYIKGAYNARCGEFKGVALDTLKNKIRIITLGGGGAVCPFDMCYVREDQKQRILNIIKTHFITGHNLKFDLKSIMASYGEQYCPDYCFDTMLASRMIHMACDPEDAQMGHSLGSAAFRFLNYKMNKEVDHTWGQDNLSQEQLKYAGNDVKILRPLREEQIRQFMQIYGPFDTVNYDISKLEFLGPLVKYHPVLALEMQTMLEVARIENTGVKPNVPMMERMIDYYNKVIDDTDSELGINCGSSKQCVELLQKRIGPHITSSEKGVLWDICGEHPFVERIIESKAARTRKGLMESMSINNLHPVDKRIHASFNQLLSTGRFACANPNMQQIPRNIKNDVYMSSEDTLVFDTDYAAVELRIEAVVSGDPLMIEAYKNNADLHYLTASKLFEKQIPHTPEEKEDAEKNPNSKFICKEDRGKAKRFNFGLIYGMHWTTFMAQCKGDWVDMTEEDAKKYYDMYFDTYKGIKNLIDTAKNVFMTGQDRTIPRWIKYANGSMHKMDKKVPFFTQCQTLLGRRLAVDTERKLMNYPVQGSGADAIKLAICKVGQETRKLNSTYRTINLVHDDTVGEVQLKDFDVSSKLFRDALEFAINYILRYKFHTPVEQDFCILSMFGEEIFLEKALTVEDIDKKLVEQIQHDIGKMNEEEDPEKKTEWSVNINRKYHLLEKFRAKVKDIESSKQKELQVI